MTVYRYIVKSTTQETMDLLKLSQSSSTPVFEEIRTVIGDHKLATLAYEKYGFYTNQPTSLFITLHDFYDQVEVTVISTTHANRGLFNFDSMIAANYIRSVKKALHPVLISETKLADR